MVKDILNKSEYLIIFPKRYFKDYIVDKEFSLSDLVCTGAAFISLATVLYWLSFYYDFINLSIFQSVIRLTGFVFGQVLLCVFRTYFITTLVKMNGGEADYKKVGIIVEVAIIANIILFFISALFQSAEYAAQIGMLMKIWNLSLILTGVLTLTGIGFFRGFWIVLIMAGYEFMLRIAFVF